MQWKWEIDEDKGSRDRMKKWNEGRRKKYMQTQIEEIECRSRTNKLIKYRMKRYYEERKEE